MKKLRLHTLSSIQHGQALLVVVLIMVVVLTVGLSVAARTIVNLRTSTEEENSERAFSAAEAGIERALVATSGSPITDTTLGNNANFTANITPLSGADIAVNNGAIITQDSGADIWLVNHNADGTPNWFTSPWSPAGGSLRFYWGTDATDCNNAALELIVLSGTNVSNVTSAHYAFDPCSSRYSTNNFDNTSIGSGTSSISNTNGDALNYRYGVTIPTITNGLMIRAIPLYKNDYIAVHVNSGTNLPEQGRSVSSTGSINDPSTTGVTKRKITVFKGWPSLPDEFFQYVVFQPNP